MTCFKIVPSIVLFWLLIAPSSLLAQGDSADASIADTATSVSVAKVLKGTASFYHDKFEGRKMANGHNFSQKNLTAACNVLPMNKWVKVTSLANNRSVIVKITDRMHPKNKRLIDLSLIAAKKIKMVGHGLMKVKVEVLKNYKPPKVQ